MQGTRNRDYRFKKLRRRTKIVKLRFNYVQHVLFQVGKNNRRNATNPRYLQRSNIISSFAFSFSFWFIFPLPHLSFSVPCLIDLATQSCHNWPCADNMKLMSRPSMFLQGNRAEVNLFFKINRGYYECYWSKVKGHRTRRQRQQN